MNLASIEQRIAEISDRLSEIDRAHTAQRFPAEVRTEWNALNQERDELKATRDECRTRLQTMREQLAEAAADPNPDRRESGDGNTPISYNNPATRRAKVHDGSRAAVAHFDALRAIDAHDSILSSEAGDTLTDLIERRDPTGVDSRYIAAVANPHYSTAFGKLVRDPQTGHLRHTPQEVEAMRLVNEAKQERGLVGGVGAQGGFALPITIDPTLLLSSSGALNPVRTVARVETVGTREWRGVTTDGVVASYDAEASEVSDDTPVLVQPTALTATGRVFVPFSHELDDDWTSLQQELQRITADARDVLDSDKFLNGSGTNEPHGIYTGLTVTQRVQSVAATINTVGVYALKAGLPPRFTVNGTFAYHPTRLDNIYKSVGGGSAEPPLLPTREGNLIGKPKIEWTALDASTVTVGTKVALYGDFQNFLIADRIGMRVELIQNLVGANRRPTGERGFYAEWRTATKVLVPNAFRYLEIS
jgi:HK97 family phage major capsid protein